MKRTPLLIIVLASVLLTACHHSGDDYYYHELNKIDHRNNRDLARRELAQLKGQTDNCADYVRQYHRLVELEMNQASPKLDDLMSTLDVVKFYEETHDRKKLIRSYIIAGTIAANCNDGPRALTYYHKAEALLTDGKDPERQKQLDAKMARLLLHQNMPEAAIKYGRRILQHCEQDRDTAGMIQALRYISESYREEHVPHNILTPLHEAYDLAQRAHLYPEQTELMLDIGRYYCDRGHYPAAQRYVMPLRNKSLDSKRYQADVLLSQIYYHTGKTDSALYFGQRVLKEGNAASKRDAHEILAHIAIQQGRREEAEEHFSLYKELNDELNYIANNEAIAQADAFYHNQRQEQENAQLKADNSFKQNIIITGTALVAILVVLFATYIQRHRRRQELMEMRIEHLQQLKKDFAKTNAEEIKRAEQTIESSNIWQRLATLPDHEHPTDDDWQQLAEAVDEAYEGFTGRLMHLCHHSIHELHVSLLLKAGFEPVRISTLTLRSKAAISTVRSRLYEKTFGKKGSAKDWDEVIRTL